MLHPRSSGIPTISIGNLSAGGTGKTPHVVWLAKALEHRFNIGVISRGYGRSSEGYRRVEIDSSAREVGDEPLLIKRLCPACAVVVCADRVEGASRLCSEDSSIDFLILDDAFQHRRIARDFDVLLSRFDAPWWSDKVLPAGYLRESARGARRANAVLFTGAPADLSLKAAREMAERAGRELGIDCFFSKRVYGALRTLDGSEAGLDSVEHLVALSGIAHPKAFEDQVRSMVQGVALSSVALRDHSPIGGAEIEQVRSLSKNLNFAVVMTEKDAVRLDSSWPRDWRTLVLPLEVELLFDGRALFLKRLLLQVSGALG